MACTRNALAIMNANTKLLNIETRIMMCNKFRIHNSRSCKCERVPPCVRACVRACVRSRCDRRPVWHPRLLCRQVGLVFSSTSCSALVDGAALFFFPSFFWGGEVGLVSIWYHMLLRGAGRTIPLPSPARPQVIGLPREQHEDFPPSFSPRRCSDSPSRTHHPSSSRPRPLPGG